MLALSCTTAKATLAVSPGQHLPRQQLQGTLPPAVRRGACRRGRNVRLTVQHPDSEASGGGQGGTLLPLQDQLPAVRTDQHAVQEASDDAWQTGVPVLALLALLRRPPAAPADQPSAAQRARDAEHAAAAQRARADARDAGAFVLLALYLLTALLVVGRPHFGWLFWDGLALDVRGWQRLLEHKMVPLFTHYFLELGESPRAAASLAARAAAVRSRALSYEQVAGSLVLVFTAATAFAIMAVCSFVRAVRKLRSFCLSK
ncbi:hypothetical protein ABPG75_007218 [Micractinium tetrahymenae]